MAIDSQLGFTLYASKWGGYTAPSPNHGQEDLLMKTKLVALTALLIPLTAAVTSAATRLMGAGCCPLCK